VLRDVAEPSAAINPDYVTYRLDLKSGRALIGTVRTEGDRLLVGDGQGATTTVARADVESMEPMAHSTMPEGLPKLLGPERLRRRADVPPDGAADADYGKLKPPPPRPRAEVLAALAGGGRRPPRRSRSRSCWWPARRTTDSANTTTRRGARVWSELLGAADRRRVTTADEWPSAEQLATADVVVFYQRGDWTPRRAKEIDAYLARGGGLVYLHWALDGRADAPGFAQRIGLASGAGALFRHGPLDVDFPSAGHPVARNVAKLRMVDESYWKLTGDLGRARVLATGVEEGKSWRCSGRWSRMRGRVFVSVPGHYAWTFDDPLFRVVLLRGIAWAAKEPGDRFNELVWPGARVGD